MDGGGEDVAAVRRRRSGDQPGRAPEGAAGVVLMDSLILTSGRLFVARVVQDLKLQTVSVWQLEVWPETPILPKPSFS